MSNGNRPPTWQMVWKANHTDYRDGVAFQTDVDLIDILATGDGNFYVLEMKVGGGPGAPRLIRRDATPPRSSRTPGRCSTT